MIVISSSLQKSGSTLVFKYQNDIIKYSKKPSAQEHFNKYSYYGYVEKINFMIFVVLIYLNYRYGDIVVKIHRKPTLFIKLLIYSGIAKATFSFRDPRDVILSAIDHGKRSRSGLDSTRAFKDFENVDKGLQIVKNWTKNWYKWKRYNKVLFIRYESMMKDKMKYIRELADYLGYKLTEKEIKEMYENNEKSRDDSWNFNVGTTYRYKTEMDEHELSICRQNLSEILSDMGYEA